MRDFSNWKDQLPGGLADNARPESFDPIQLEKGIQVELEHVDNERLAAEIAMDHLTEDPEYYVKLATIEIHRYRYNPSDEEIEQLKQQAELGDQEAINELFDIAETNSEVALWLERRPLIYIEKEGQIWTCSGPIAGKCGVQHKSERTALICCAKYEGSLRPRRHQFWRLPHRWECHSLIYGTNYPCNCGAFERARARRDRGERGELRRNPSPDEIIVEFFALIESGILSPKEVDKLIANLKKMRIEQAYRNIAASTPLMGPINLKWNLSGQVRLNWYDEYPPHSEVEEISLNEIWDNVLLTESRPGNPFYYDIETDDRIAVFRVPRWAFRLEDAELEIFRSIRWLLPDRYRPGLRAYDVPAIFDD
jgi:hypothetical protein